MTASLPLPIRVGLSSGLLAASAVLLCSCQTTGARSRADRETYGVLDRIRKEQRLEGEDFTIDTSFSEADPQSIDPGAILSQRGEGKARQVSIHDSIGLAIDHSRDYQDRREQLYLTALTYTGERHRFRRQWFAGTLGRKTWLPRTDGDGTSETFVEVDTAFGVDHALVTGAEIGISIVNDLLRFYTGDPRRAAISVLNFNVVQPLLRGTGHRVAAEQLTQSFRNVIYETRDYTHFQSQFVRDVVVSYFRLLQDKDGVFNAYNDYTSRVKATEYLQARAVDRENPLDVRQAEQAELSAKNRYIDSVVRYRDSVDAFKLRLGIPIPTRLRLNDDELTRLRGRGLVALDVSRETAVNTALRYRLPLLNEIDRFEDAQRRIIVAADALEADLVVVGNASFLSEAPLDYTDFSFSNLEADVALQLDLPVNRKFERNAYRASLVQFQEEIRSLGLTMDTLRRDIDRRLRQLDQFELNYSIQQKSVAQARLRVEGAQLKLAAGTAIFRDLEEAQDALIQAQNAVTAALVDHLEARLNLLVTLGILDWEQDRFWLSTSAGRIELPRADRREEVEQSILRGDEVIPPDELFSDS